MILYLIIFQQEQIYIYIELEGTYLDEKSGRALYCLNSIIYPANKIFERNAAPAKNPDAKMYRVWFALYLSDIFEAVIVKYSEIEHNNKPIVSYLITVLIKILFAQIKEINKNNNELINKYILLKL